MSLFNVCPSVRFFKAFLHLLNIFQILSMITAVLHKRYANADETYLAGAITPLTQSPRSRDRLFWYNFLFFLPRGIAYSCLQKQFFRGFWGIFGFYLLQQIKVYRFPPPPKKKRTLLKA